MRHTHRRLRTRRTLHGTHHARHSPDTPCPTPVSHSACCAVLRLGTLRVAHDTHCVRCACFMQRIICPAHFAHYVVSTHCARHASRKTCATQGAHHELYALGRACTVGSVSYVSHALCMICTAHASCFVQFACCTPFTTRATHSPRHTRWTLRMTRTTPEVHYARNALRLKHTVHDPDNAQHALHTKHAGRFIVHTPVRRFIRSTKVRLAHNTHFVQCAELRMHKVCRASRA